MLVSINVFAVMNLNAYVCTMINLVALAMKVSKDCLPACC